MYYPFYLQFVLETFDSEVSIRRLVTFKLSFSRPAICLLNCSVPDKLACNHLKKDRLAVGVALGLDPLLLIPGVRTRLSACFLPHHQSGFSLG
jgi:hypothetical protein